MLNIKDLFKVKNKLQIISLFILWLCYLIINVVITHFFNSKEFQTEILLQSLFYSIGGFMFSYIGYGLMKIIRTKIQSNIHFVILSILSIYLVSILWMILHHFSWWIVSGDGIFTMELKLYPIKALIYFIIILAAILLLLLTENKSLSILKYDNEKKSNFNVNNVQDLFENNESNFDETILLPINSKILHIKINTIKLIQANDYYSNIISESYDKAILSKYSLKKWELILPKKHFLRIHRSSIVNLNFIDNIEKMQNNTYEVKIKGQKQSVNMSRRCAKIILDRFQL